MTTVDVKSSSKISINEARQLNDEVEREALVPGANWYLIAHGWWMRFMELKDNPGQGDCIQLPPINNASLVVQTVTGYKLKPKLVEALNFVFVPERVFNVLNNAFSVELPNRDIITRQVVEGTLMEKKTFIELYPLEINIAHFKKRDAIVMLKVSQSENIDNICAKAITALKIPKSESKNIRFLVEENGKFEALSTTINKFTMNSILTSGAIIYIDETGASSSVLQNQKESEVHVKTRLDEYSVFKSLGLCGLQNLGNTCFMNSALQCLSNVPELTEYFIKGTYLSELNVVNVLGTKGQLARAYGALIQEMWTGMSTYVKPSKLKAVIGEFAPRFNGYAQQDSQELTSFLLDGLHEDLNRIIKKPYVKEKDDDTIPHETMAIQAWTDYKRRNDSIIVDLMHGQLKSTVVCPVCEKISVKFDPFCFLSLPVPAKERQTSSIITLIRKDKWAKFAITHTNKATVEQATTLMKANLQLPESTRIVLLTLYAMEVLTDNTILTPSPYATSSTVKNYYAYIVDEGPLTIVENKAYDRAIGVPLVVNFPGNGTKLSRKLILDNIFPIVKDRMFKSQNQDEKTNEDVDNTENTSPNYKAKVNSSSQQPSEIIFYCDKKYINLPMNIEETVKIPKDSAMDFKIVLRWASSDNFQHVDLSRLVERELNMITPLKKCYTLNECVNLFTSQEQLDQNDSWYCPRCKEHQRAFKKLDLWSLPKILIVHLKRFHYSRYSRDKIDTEIIIPTRGLDLSNKVQNPNQKSEKYDLIAISNHMGGLGSGHYTALALNENRWIDFNDSMITVTKSSLPESFASREAYILYYHRRNENSAENVNSETNVNGLQQANVNGECNFSFKSLNNDSFSPVGKNSNVTFTSNNSTPSKRRASESIKMEVDDDNNV